MEEPFFWPIFMSLLRLPTFLLTPSSKFGPQWTETIGLTEIVEKRIDHFSSPMQAFMLEKGSSGMWSGHDETKKKTTQI